MNKILLTASYHKAKGEFGAYSEAYYIKSMRFHLTKIVVKCKCNRNTRIDSIYSREHTKITGIKKEE